jgi:ATP-dependent DNA helicase RecG
LHELALATMFHGQPVGNATLREFGASPATATAVLRDLVTRNLAVRTGGRRYATYSLDTPVQVPEQPSLFPEVEELISADLVTEAMRERKVATARELIEATGYSRPTVLARLDELIKEGLVSAEGAPNSPKRRYLWTRIE